MKFRKVNSTRILFAAALSTASVLATSIAPTAHAAELPFSVPEQQASFATLQEAINSIGSAEATVVAEPGVYRECARQTQGTITYRSAVPDQKVVLDSVLCDEKGALVLGGTWATIEDFEFANIYSETEGNGAGIRHEAGNLTIRNSTFRDSQEGVLSGADISANVIVEKSEFSGLGGYCMKGECAHSLYIGQAGSLVVRDSKFSHSTGGHFIKYRGPEAWVYGNTFDDSESSNSIYLVEFPEHTSGSVNRNTFIQGANKTNHTGMVVIGQEYRTRKGRLKIFKNSASLAPGAAATNFVYSRGKKQKVSVKRNQLGRGITELTKVK